jgi:hypothetical protein
MLEIRNKFRLLSYWIRLTLESTRSPLYSLDPSDDWDAKGNGLTITITAGKIVIKKAR